MASGIATSSRSSLILGRDNLFPDNWIYIHSPDVKVGRIQNFNNWSKAMVPVPGKTCLGLEYFCFEGDGLWESPDAELIAQASASSSSLGLASASDVEDGVVVRVPKAYPIYDATIAAISTSLRAFIDPIPQPAHRRPQRHAQVQQSGPLDADGDDDVVEHAGCVARRLGGEHGFRLPRGAED